MGASVWRVGRIAKEGQRDLGRRIGRLDGGKCLESGTNSRGRPKRSWEKDVEDWMRASVWRVGQTAEEGHRDLGRRMWRTGSLVSGKWDEQQRKAKEILGLLGEGCGGLDGALVSGKWDEQQRKAKEILGEGCGGLDRGKCLESGKNSRERPKRSWEKDVEDWMGASVWRVGRIAEEDQRDLGRRMWRTGWGLVSGKWDEQQRKAKEISGEGCGGLDGGKCPQSGTNSRGRPRRDLGRRMWRTGRGQVSGEWDEQQKKAKEILGEGCGGLDGG